MPQLSNMCPNPARSPNGPVLYRSVPGRCGLQSLPFDPVKDFVPVVVLVTLHNVLAVNPSLPATSVKELVDYAKKNPGKLLYGTVGIGSLQHLGGVLLAQAAAIDIEHVPYKGGSPTINDVLGGSIPMAILSATTVMPYARTGKLRALGVIHAQRSRSFPDVPRIGETVPGYAAPDQWLGLLAPSASPASVVARLNGELRRAYSLSDGHAPLLS